MDWQRILLLSGITVVILMLFQEWNKQDQEFRQAALPAVAEEVLPSYIGGLPTEQDAPIVQNTGDDIPSISSEPEPDIQALTSQLVSIKTDALNVLIDTNGGDIVKVSLPKYLQKLDESSGPFVLLNKTSSRTYLAQSGLIGKNGTDKKGVRPVFSSVSNTYNLDDNDELNVDLVYQQDDVTITKRFSFKRNSYLISVSYLIDNQSSETWNATLFGQIKRDTFVPESDSGFGMQPFVGAALTTSEDNYIKYSFDDINDQTVSESIQGGWVAMLQHYFISAWVPDKNMQNSYSLRKLKSGLFAFGFIGSELAVSPGAQGELNAGFYAGPKDQIELATIAPHLELTIDYGWAWWISGPLFTLLGWMHGLVGNWGGAILLLTLCVRIPLYPLFAKSARSMAGMRKIQPEMTRMKELYGDDRQRMSQEMMSLYKKHGVNPMGGCLPMLIPMPIFIGLYYMLFESVELRHADWLWIADLSVKDPLFILPLVMGLTMWLQQKLNPQPAEAAMAQAMKMMPIMFTFMFMWFPSGLVLYWTTNNIFSIIQSYLVNKQVENS